MCTTCFVSIQRWNHYTDHSPCFEAGVARDAIVDHKMLLDHKHARNECNLCALFASSNETSHITATSSRLALLRKTARHTALQLFGAPVSSVTSAILGLSRGATYRWAVWIVIRMTAWSRMRRRCWRRLTKFSYCTRIAYSDSAQSRWITIARRCACRLTVACWTLRVLCARIAWPNTAYIRIVYIRRRAILTRVFTTLR